jgi:hypothetical protein
MTQKRKRAPSTSVKSKKPILKTMTTSAQPAQSSTTPSPAVPNAPTKKYGVYQHSDLSDLTGTSALLVATAPDFTSAYTLLRAHAGNEIDKHAHWGATYTRTSHDTYEITDPDDTVQMRYSIDTMLRSENETWTREQSQLAQDSFEHPKEHYGMYIDMPFPSSSSSVQPQSFIIGGFASLGEACHTMKTCARAWLAQHSSAQLMERSIELVDEKGSVRQRYRIERGRWVGGGFVSEEEWMGWEIVGGGEVEEVMRGKVEIKRLTTPTPMGMTEVERDEEEEKAEAEAEAVVNVWCTCREPDDGSLMVCCENEECAIKWYHGRCIGLKKEPKGAWWCAECAPGHALTVAARGVRGKGRQAKTTVKDEKELTNGKKPVEKGEKAAVKSEEPVVKGGRKKRT